MSGTQPQDGLVAVTQLYVAIIATGYVVQAVSSLRGEESSGRLEVRLSGTLSRTRWLAAHGLVIVIGLIVIVVASSVVLATGMALSLGDAVPIDRILGAGLVDRPAELLLGALALALFGLWGQGRSPLPGRPSPSSPSSRSWARALTSPDGCSTSTRRPTSAIPRSAPCRRCRSSSSVASRRSSGSPRPSAFAVEACPRAECDDGSSHEIRGDR